MYAENSLLCILYPNVQPSITNSKCLVQTVILWAREIEANKHKYILIVICYVLAGEIEGNKHKYILIVIC